MLKAQRWSGNIRELQNCIEKAVILSDGATLTEKDLQLDAGSKSGMTAAADVIPGLTSSVIPGLTRNLIEAEEERLVREAMDRTGGNISAAAKLLGVSRPTLYAKLKKYGL